MLQPAGTYKVAGEAISNNAWKSNTGGVVALQVTSDKEEQLAKAASPIEVTLSGIVMDTKEEQPEKVLSPISVMPLGMLIEAKEEQPENA